MAHLTTEQLTERMAGLAAMPTDNGSVAALVLRPETDAREIVDSLHVVPGQGIVGDNYVARGSSRTPDGKAHPEAKICMMNWGILGTLCDGDDALWPMAGDQLLVDFDISTDNIPAGTRMSIGSAVLEVSNKPHNGCAKFAERFGMDAARWVNSDAVQRYRGINVMVVTEGDIAVGDTITKLDERGNGSFPPA